MRQIFYLLFFCYFFSCQNRPAETRTERIAGGICACATPVLELNKQASSNLDSLAFERIQAAFEKARTCIIEQRMKKEDLPEVQKTLLIKCPELANQTELLQELLE